MTHPIENYLRFINPAETIDELHKLSAKFMVENKLVNKCVVINHRTDPRPFEIITQFWPDFDLQTWRDDFARFSKNVDTLSAISTKNYVHYFLQKPSSFGSHPFLVCDTKPSTDIEPLLSIWANIIRVLKKQEKQIKQYCMEEKSHWISQLLHDVESLIHIAERYTA
ncbi:MAG: hypothetical protein GF313_02925, partial [Caldithrix sp.]|nr:hypothetical protein [Caldithrix sp.]